jgi:HK97 family phage major capsid protein
MEALRFFGGIDGGTGELTTETGAFMPYPTLNDTTNRGRIIGENTQVVQTDPVFNSVTFNAYILCSDLCLIPISLMQDSYFDMDGLLARMLGTRLGRLLNYECTLGSGSGEPLGIIPAAISSGLITTLAPCSTTSIAYNDLINLQHSVDPAYRYGPGSKCRFMFNDSTLKVLRKLVDTTGRPLFLPPLTASLQDGVGENGDVLRLLGHDVIINQDMASPAASASSVLFGDMSTFILRKVGRPSVLRLTERWADYLQIGFLAFWRVDSRLVDAGTHPLAVLQQSAT